MPLWIGPQVTTIASSGSLSGTIMMRGAVLGHITMPDALTAGTLNFLTSSQVSGGTFRPLYDQYNTLVSLVVSGSRSYPLPAELAGADGFRLMGAGTVEASARSFVVNLKG